MQSLCTLRDHCRQWPRNTRYQADATPYLGRTCTGWIAPACGWRTLLDHLVGAREQCGRHGQAERLPAIAIALAMWALIILGALPAILRPTATLPCDRRNLS